MENGLWCSDTVHCTVYTVQCENTVYEPVLTVDKN